MKKLIVLALLLAPTLAFAQQGTPNEQAMSRKLLLEIDSGLQCSAQVIGLEAEVKRLRDKYEPKVEEKK